MSGVFISYRRDDTSYIAGRLHRELAARFGTDQIFRDIDTMGPGVDFGAMIQQEVGKCDALVAVIGKDWLASDDPSGRRRIDDPSDWVQLEIAAALDRGVLVIPVLVEDARMPEAAELPATIRGLARRNAVELTDSRWDYDVGRLMAALEGVVRRDATTPAWAPAPAWTSAPERPPPGRRRPEAPSPHPTSEDPGSKLGLLVGAAVVAVLALAVAVLAVGGNDDEGEIVLPSLPGSSTTGDRGTALDVGPTTQVTAATTTTLVANGPWSAAAEGVRLTVERVVVSDGPVAELHLLAENSGGQTVELRQFQVVEDTGKAHEQPFVNMSVPNRTPVREVVTVPIGEGARSLNVGFNFVFPLRTDSLTVRSVPVPTSG